MNTDIIMSKAPQSGSSIPPSAGQAPGHSSVVARKAMIDSQLRTSGVNEEFALSRMMSVPREGFLPDEKHGLAYIDRSIALGDDAHLASPLFYGKLLLEAAPSPSDRVLIVEGGTGYLTELVSPLVSAVSTIGSAQAAKGDWPDATFTLIMIDGAVEELPKNVGDIVEDGGRIVSGLLLREVTRLASGRKVAGHIALDAVEDMGIPVLHAFDRPKSWAF